MNKPKLEDWAVVFNHISSPSLTGIVTGHPKLEDGKNIITSNLRMISVSRNMAKTENTVYELGKPSEDFLKYLEFIGKSIKDYEFGKLDN